MTVNSPTPVVEATVKGKKPEFESIMKTSFSKGQGHTMTRTVAVGLISTLFFPLLVLVDLGRWLAFSVGLVNGKSFSLIDKTSDACQKVANKIYVLWNGTVEKRVGKDVKNLVNAYRRFNDGLFNSSPAVSAEQDIRKYQQSLVKLIGELAGEKSSSTAQFASQVQEAKQFVVTAIQKASLGSLYIENKVKRKGPPPCLGDVIQKEFLAAFGLSTSALGLAYGKLAVKEADFPAALRLGLDNQYFLSDHVKEIIQKVAPKIFLNKLPEGLKPAQEFTEGFLSSAVTKKLISKEEKRELVKQAKVDISELASGAAVDILMRAPGVASDEEVVQQLEAAAENSITQGYLQPTDKPEFIAKAKTIIDSEQGKQQAAIVAETAASDQAQGEVALVNDIVKLLGLIQSKQKNLSVMCTQYEEKDAARKAINRTLEELTDKTVLMNGKQVKLTAIIEPYKKAMQKIQKNLVPQDRVKLEQALCSKEFPQQSIEQIKKYLALLSEVQAIDNELAVLQTDIMYNYREIEEYLVASRFLLNDNKRTFSQKSKQLVETVQRSTDNTQNQLAIKMRTFGFTPLTVRSTPLTSAGIRGQLKDILVQDSSAPELEAETAETVEEEEQSLEVVVSPRTSQLGTEKLEIPNMELQKTSSAEALKPSGSWYPSSWYPSWFQRFFTKSPVKSLAEIEV
ncbi:MAG: hypothetical protein A2796_04670 [Chlamydiae bacterium RIFCSPHIGHO2_01_FULL_44_39]|nr:MAG: hypothetical protein A2796_04670 [Chlamydiae bacterium RIFCSPHIGHO2_01_FULL_44_39]OGN66938.1 MAG: hypothetical protein A2978_02210 [Chlamydiae bacterium RIFCSPLOWO2_01_FULL_44_52]OGN67490.1 MAG: hypothetical protein A3I67_03425 [Chlamydiae bacterium RIFCSPLOWO2_02_FULL_45_22]OGN71191.1 MAG: hypothetical protein A3F79_02450 [Chlamydiae bacterium RIFCSPLOWO2_12_FULL_45_20]